MAPSSLLRKVSSLADTASSSSRIVFTTAAWSTGITTTKPTSSINPGKEVITLRRADGEQVGELAELSQSALAKLLKAEKLKLLSTTVSAALGSAHDLLRKAKPKDVKEARLFRACGLSFAKNYDVLWKIWSRTEMFPCLLSMRQALC